MKKSKTVRWSVFIGILIVLVVAAVVAGLFLGKIAKAGIETIGPKITKVPITVNSVNLSLLSGSAKIEGLVVGNPKGYKTPQAISVGVAAVGVNPFSIFSDKIVVRSIHVQSPEITFEGDLGGNNLSKIMDNVNATAQAGGPVSTNATGQAKPAKKLEVDDFLITGAKVHVSLTGMGGKEMTLPLPPIHLTDWGKGPEGITATDLTRRMLEAITSATVKAVAQNAANLGKGAENLGKQGIKEGVNTLKKGIGNLLGK